jgi:hypothetical protein
MESGREQTMAESIREAAERWEMMTARVTAMVDGQRTMTTGGWVRRREGDDVRTEAGKKSSVLKGSMGGVNKRAEGVILKQRIAVATESTATRVRAVDRDRDPVKMPVSDSEALSG